MQAWTWDTGRSPYLTDTLFQSCKVLLPSWADWYHWGRCALPLFLLLYVTIQRYPLWLSSYVSWSIRIFVQEDALAGIFLPTMRLWSRTALQPSARSQSWHVLMLQGMLSRWSHNRSKCARFLGYFSGQTYYWRREFACTAVVGIATFAKTGPDCPLGSFSGVPVRWEVNKCAVVWGEGASRKFKCCCGVDVNSVREVSVVDAEFPVVPEKPCSYTFVTGGCSTSEAVCVAP